MAIRETIVEVKKIKKIKIHLTQIKGINMNENIDFKDKVVSFGTVSGEILAIKNPEFKTINNKLFIVGRIPKNATINDWALDRDSGVSWDSITEYMIFDSEEQYVELKDKSYE
jgi:hypothetical protein